MNYIALGKNIKKYRLLAGLRQSDLAKLCNCSDSLIGQVERGRTVPSLDTTVRIANALNVTVDALLYQDLKFPERIYLKDIAEKLESYPVAKRIRACESLITYLDMLEQFGSDE